MRTTSVMTLMLAACGGATETGAGTEGTGNEPSATCAAYLSCLEAVGLTAALATAETDFGPASDCWQDAALGISCTNDCDAELDDLRVNSGTLAACWEGDGYPTTDVFAFFGTTWVVDDATEPEGCNRFPGNAVIDSAVFEGTDTSDFTLRAVEIQATVAVVEGSCTLEDGASFACTATNPSFTMSGSFNSSFDLLSFNVDRTLQDGSVDPCALTAAPQ